MHGETAAHKLSEPGRVKGPGRARPHAGQGVDGVGFSKPPANTTLAVTLSPKARAHYCCRLMSQGLLRPGLRTAPPQRGGPLNMLPPTNSLTRQLCSGHSVACESMGRASQRGPQPWAGPAVLYGTPQPPNPSVCYSLHPSVSHSLLTIIKLSVGWLSRLHP